MTAIAGVVGAAEELLVPICARMLGKLKPYGSDEAVEALDQAAFGVTVHRNASAVASILAPPDGRYLFVADIRLDNRKELQRAIGEDRQFDDAALAAKAWERWNYDCFERLAGDFAIAILDRRTGELTLARDHTGQRPLFYTRAQGRLAFASMPSALLALPWLPGRFNFERLAAIPLGASTNTSETYLHGIRKVGPGECVTFRREGENRRLYWQPRRDPLSLSPGDYVEAYHAQLEQAVAPRLDSGPTGLQLSSGFDSCSIAVTASRLGADPSPIAFTAAPERGFDGPVPRGRIGDESTLAELTVRRLGLRHVIVRPSGSMLSQLKRDAHLYQDPDRNIANMHWWSAILSQARDLGIRTILTGQMGNLSIHAGGLAVLSEWIGHLQPLTWWKEARHAARSGSVRWRGILYNSFEPWIPDLAQQAIWRAFQGQPAAGENFLRREWSERVLKKLTSGPGPHRRGDLFDDRLANIRTQDTGTFRLGALAESGVEERDPTADFRLIEFSLNLPPEQLFHKGVSRPLARRSLQPHLPAEVLNSPSRGYQAADWYQRIDKAQAHQLIDEIAASHSANQLLDLGRLRWAVDSWPTTDQASVAARTIYRRRWTLALSIGVFLKEFEASA